MTQPVVAPNSVAADRRLLWPDLHRPGAVLRTREAQNADVATRTGEDAAVVLERVERELADAAERYRTILWVGLGMLFLPLLLAGLMYQELSALDTAFYEPFQRGFYVPGLSLYEILCYALLGILGVIAVRVSRDSIRAMRRLGPDYRYLVDAPDQDRSRLAEEAASGRWPRAVELLRRGNVFRPLYRAQIDEAAGRHADSVDEPKVENESFETPTEQVPWRLSSAIALTVLTVGITFIGSVSVGWILGYSTSRLAFRFGIPAALIVSYGITIGAVALFSRGRGVPLAKSVGLTAVPLKETLILGLTVGVLGRAISALWVWVLEFTKVSVPLDFGDPSKLAPVNPWGALASFIAICVFAPLAEEMVFRGALLPALAGRMDERRANLIVSAVFSLVHASVVAVPPLFVFSLLLGRLRLKSGSLWPSLVAHAVFNAIGVLGVYAVRLAGLL